MWWRIPFRIVGGVILAYACVMSLILFSSVRLEGGDDLDAVVRQDVGTGLAIALGVFLIGISQVGKSMARRFALLAITSLLAGSVIGGGLALSHFEQHRIRSTWKSAPK